MCIVDPANEIMRMANAYRLSQAIYVAADLRLSDHLAAGPLSSADLAAAAGCDDRALYRLMRALCSAGVYEEGADGRFAATAIGEELRSGSERGLGDWTRFVGRPDVWRTWGALGH